MNINTVVFSICTRCPKWMWKWLSDILFQWQYRKCLDEVLHEWSSRVQEDPDLEKALSYLQETGRWTWFPGEYVEKYKRMKIEVYRDEDGFPFVQLDGKRLYFPKHLSKSWVADVYRSLMCEQDSESPHCYFSNAFNAPQRGEDGGEILLDVGAAEAIISLKYVEQVKRIVIFECNEEWVQALEKTFYPYQEKVTIVNKYVSNSNEGNRVRLDDYISNIQDLDGFDEKYIIKMDIEGSESAALEGCAKLMESKKSRFVVCTYHQPNDEEKFEKLFKSMGYQTLFSKNYMLYGGLDPENSFGKPSFRRGVIQAWPLKCS